ncbi:MAG: acetyl-CoA carboxylase biotin carboxyl carrier protein [Aestuariibaculum sp.]
MDIKEIQNLIKFVAKSGANEVKLEMDDFKITIKTGADQGVTAIQYAPIAQQIPQPVSTPIPAVEQTKVAETLAPIGTSSTEDSKYITIKSPIIGTFYRKPAPDKPLFVEVGQTIAEGDVLCIIEAMKLFNEIESEVSGKIVKILVDDSSPVEFDQPLFLVDPS